MSTVGPEVDRFLTLLRNKIREQGFTQLEVQEALGWGRSYISQLLTRQKALRVEQILLILNVIGSDPGDFFRELYGAPPAFGKSRYDATCAGALQGDLENLRSLVHGLTDLLLGENLISAEDLSSAVESVEQDSGASDSMTSVRSGLSA